jgi:two-component system NtrC family response regulator
VEALERTMIHRALQTCGGNRAEAARRLGIYRQLLYKKLKLMALTDLGRRQVRPVAIEAEW